MRRLLAAAGLVVALAVLGLALLGRSAQSADTMRVDAIFDTAKGIVPGQVVKIAGARVGRVDDVKLTGDYKARMVMSVPARFAFRKDASCTIQPEGLISENFVQCDPGKPSAPELERQDGVPTVPVERTTVPVSISDLFRIFQTDVRQRFTVAIAAFGGGLAARGEDLNAAIRRANPTLAAVNELLGRLASEKAQLSSAVRDTDRVLAELTPRRRAVADFVTQAARVTERTGRRSGDLQLGLQRLPSLLDATDRSLDALDDLTTRGRPLLADLRSAAPDLNRVLAEIGPFSRAATPALKQLGDVAVPARRSVRRALPVVSELRTFAATALPVGRTLSVALRSLRDTGFVEQLNNFLYYGAATSSRYDSTSHLFAVNLIVNGCSPFATTPVAGCNSFYRANPSSRKAAQRDDAKPGKRRKGKEDDGGDEPAATPTPGAGTPAPSDPTATPTAAPTAPSGVLGPLLDALPKPTPSASATPTPKPASPDILSDLSEFLLGR